MKGKEKEKYFCTGKREKKNAKNHEFWKTFLMFLCSAGRPFVGLHSKLGTMEEIRSLKFLVSFIYLHLKSIIYDLGKYSIYI